MSMELVGRSFKGIGLDLYKVGLRVKPELLGDDGYPDEYLDSLHYDLVAREGEGPLSFGMEPIFPWENAAVREIRTRDEACAHVANALKGRVQFDDGREPTYEEILAMVGDVDEAWTELW